MNAVFYVSGDRTGSGDATHDPSVMIKHADPLPVQQCSLDELIRWRNSASKRVDARCKAIKQLGEKMKHEDKLNSKDLLWIKKLNRIISHKAFGYRKSNHVED